MAYVIKLETGFDIKEQFVNAERDYYPLGVYDYIAEYGDEQPDTELDVIAWCGEIDHKSYDDYVEENPELADELELSFDDMVDELSNDHTIIYADEIEQVVYFHNN